MGQKLVSLVADRVKQELTPHRPINERVEYTLTKMQSRWVRYIGQM